MDTQDDPQQLMQALVLASLTGIGWDERWQAWLAYVRDHPSPPIEE